MIADQKGSRYLIGVSGNWLASLARRSFRLCVFTFKSYKLISWATLARRENVVEWKAEDRRPPCDHELKSGVGIRHMEQFKTHDLT